MPSTRSRRLLRAGAPVVLLCAAALVPLAGAAPTCTTVPQAACGDRVIAEPMQSLTFLQYGMELVPVLDAIEAIAPDVVEVMTLGEAIGQPDLMSAGGRDIWVIRVTDEKAPRAAKRQVALSLSIHGQENAGREGGLRYLEDLARWSVNDPDHLVYAGERSYPVSQVLRETEVWFGLINPDGWAAGDVENGFVGARANDNGTDLNRQFPTAGWTAREHLTDPEGIGWHTLVEGFPNFATGTDIHGELNSSKNSYADVMWPAGEWSPDMQAKEAQFGIDMVATVNRKFDEYGVVLSAVFGEGAVFDAATVSTGYDVVGYDDSGFMGDWLTQTGAVELDVENFLSHSAPGSVWVGPHEQAHAAAVRGIIESTIVTSMFTHTIETDVDLGRVAYVFDPQRFTRTAKPGEKAYDVSRMQYFLDLARDTGVAVTRLDAADVATADLSQFDSVVLADLTVPPDPKGRQVNRSAYVAALDGFAKSGGQLVLTDRAVTLLPELGLFADEDGVGTTMTNAGHVEFGTLDHRWEEGINPAQEQTYYEVPLGMPPTDSAPHYGVTQTAWEAAGGTTVGVVTPSETGAAVLTDLGEIARGEGTIALFGAILPTQSIEEDHPNGLLNYAVSVAGGQVLHNILEFKRAGAPAPAPVEPPAPAPVTPPAPKPPARPLPATGGTAPVLAVLAVAAAYALRRRTQAVG